MGRGKETIDVKLENVPITMGHSEDTTVPSVLSHYSHHDIDTSSFGLNYDSFFHNQL